MNSFLELLAFIVFLTGTILIFDIKLGEFVSGISKLFLWQPKKKLKTRVLIATGKKKTNWFLGLIDDSVNILKVNKKQQLFPVICMISFILSVSGILLGMVLKNYFLSAVLGTGCLVTPFLYTKLLGFRLRKLLNEELETALSIVTSSYIRSENIVSAVEENIKYINSPVREVFEQFLFEAQLINPDIKKLLKDMKKKLDNSVFQEWCDALVSCQEDAKLKSTLLPIAKKLSNMRVVTAKLDAMLYEPVKEYITMVVLVVSNIPLMYLINRNWYRILIYNILGKISLALCAAVIFVSFAAVIKVTRPIEYKR